MKTNLLLLDSYKDIDDLIAYAFSFSNRSKRNLKIVYVFDFDWMRQSFMVGAAGPVDPAMVAAEKNAKKEFNVAEAKIREVAADYMKKHSVKIPFEIHITEMNRIDFVQEELNRVDDLMLLVSNHQSYSEASGGLVGYPNLVDHVSCPVFVVPENSRHAVMKDLVYATSFNAADLEALKHLYSLLQDVEGVHFHVVYNAKEFGYEDKLKWFGFRELVKEETGIPNLSFHLKRRKDIIQAIEEFSQENDPDLLVIVKEKRGFFEEIFTTSETKNVLTHFQKPVLIYHEK